MKLINVTNSHSRLVLQQLENTDAEMVKVYTAGDTTVVYTVAPLHNEILMVNNKRNILPQEIETIKDYFLKKSTAKSLDTANMSTITNDNFVEISIPKAI
ncbi:DUF1827 family protein [Enterococcus saccharolyticus]|uniref:Ribose-5-phosphate isomerase n=1 Tax=Candidatus Enterococcus willemsii TaxID=1857215 RepID=A0ABQ6Z1L7_9ENTE|nr:MULTISPECIES: DUF1827 family protein [Enterococcus]KAF1305394.1 ribose-5-phosphate isomerase [Enterococcus sp. CU12B]MCD5001039.1 DUF1827 family protein [Enterococcus saccharolyticus]